MSLKDVYPNVRACIVTFIPRMFSGIGKDQKPPPFPPIIGTGFIVHEDGVILTNEHVVEAFKKFKKPPKDDKKAWPIAAILFKLTDAGMLEVPLQVRGIARIKAFTHGERYYGPSKPDLAFVHVKMRGLPAVSIDGEMLIKEGMDVATAGYPLGTDLLMAPGWMHQITPTLQKGIVSAVMPFACRRPHAFAINVMTHGGASGSPVFSPETGDVLGVLYGGLVDSQEIGGDKFLMTPTTISYVVPAHYIVHSMKRIAELPEMKLEEGTSTLDDTISSAEIVEGFRGEHFYEEVPVIENENGNVKHLILKRKD